MIVADTCALVFDALSPQRLTREGRRALDAAQASDQLYCSDISLWELAMLVEKGRLNPGTDAADFIRLVVEARAIRVVPIRVGVATLAVRLPLHGDPADRIIVATAIHLGARVLTSDQKLREAPCVPALW